jgi:hypothetical protein
MLPEPSETRNVFDRHPRQARQTDHRLGDAVGQTAAKRDPPWPSPVAECRDRFRRTTLERTLDDTSDGREHQQVTSRTVQDEADGSDQGAQRDATDGAKGGDHGGLRNRQHEVGEDQQDANRPGPGIEMAEQVCRCFRVVKAPAAQPRPRLAGVPPSR